MKTAVSISILLAFCAQLVYSQDECPCTLSDAVEYPGTYRWDCMNRLLVSVPGQCWSIQSENVTEVYLSNNDIIQVSGIDLFELAELRVLYIDNNKLEFWDASALFGVDDIIRLHLEYNTALDAEEVFLSLQPDLEELILIGAGMPRMPLLRGSPLLNRVDARSNEFTTLPRPLFSDSFTSETMTFNFGGNFITDIAADILLPLPNRAIVNMDETVLIWAADADEEAAFRAKNFQSNINFDLNLKVCTDDGLPEDPTMC